MSIPMIQSLKHSVAVIAGEPCSSHMLLREVLCSLLSSFVDDYDLSKISF